MADEMEVVRRMADGNPRYMATEEDTQALARVVMDLKARVEAMEAGQVHTEASDLARTIRAYYQDQPQEPEKGMTIDYTKLRKFDIKDPGPDLGPCSHCQGARFVMDEHNRCVPCPNCLAKDREPEARP